jgi:hypothetical protein
MRDDNVHVDEVVKAPTIMVKSYRFFAALDDGTLMPFEGMQCPRGCFGDSEDDEHEDDLFESDGEEVDVF